jgi:hypothetical protein
MHSPIRGNFTACALTARGRVRRTNNSRQEAGLRGAVVTVAETEGFGMIFTDQDRGVAASEYSVPVAEVAA